MRIDLHCHTKKIKSGDSEGRNVSVEMFSKKVMEANVEIIAITNHNSFDIEQFTEFEEAVREHCQLWPGVEIDIKQPEGKRWHLIVIANPINKELFNDCVEKFFDNKDIETCTCTIEEIYASFNECDVIYITHFHKKPAISDDDYTKLLEVVGEEYRIFRETPDNRSLGVFANYGYNVMIGSDISDWNNYEKSTFAELRLPVSSFEQFCLLSKRDTTIINTLLNKRQSYNVIAKPHHTTDVPLTVYQEMNIIFGQKGTGKSEILQSIHSKLTENGLKCIKYKGTDKEDSFNSLLSIADMNKDLRVVGAEECNIEFDSIFNWGDEVPTLFSKYIDWCSTKNNNKLKEKMKITNSVELVENTPEKYNEHKTDREKIQTVVEMIEQIALSNYLYEEEILVFKQLIAKLNDVNRQLLTIDTLNIESVNLVNFTLENIKSIADKNSNTVSRPASTGFRDFALNRINLNKYVSKILENIKSDEYNSKEYIGDIEGKGKVYINKKYRMLCDKSKTAEFEGGIRGLKAIIDVLKNIQKNICNDDLSRTISDFKARCEENSINSLIKFLGLSKQIVLESGDEYSPSNGEKGILLLQQILGTDVDAYLLDEPELGMGNSYIDINIRPLITSLAKKHKTVVVATHNANIAVRTLPYMSIFRTHENGEYSTYVGNPFDDHLININDSSDIRSWVTESLHTLEGGKEAFYERKNIYETSGE